MPWPFRRRGEARRVKSEMRGYGAELLGVRDQFEAATVAHADELGWGRTDPVLVVVLAASGGATVALGGFGVAIRAQFKDEPELTTPGPSDPVWQLAQALDDPQAIMDAFRVLVWGYASELVGSLWPDRWTAVCEQLAELMNVASDAEAMVLDLPLAKRELSAEQLAQWDVEYRTSLLTAVAGAALGREIDRPNPWLRVALPAWNGFYTEGQETVAELMDDVNARLANLSAMDEIAEEHGLERQSLPAEDGPYVCHYQTPPGVEKLDPILVPNLALARLAPAVFAASCAVNSPFLRPRANDQVELVPDDRLGPEGGMVRVAPGYTIAIRRATDAEAETLPCPFTEGLSHPSPPEDDGSDEAEDEVDIDRLLEYWRVHRHEYLDPEA